MTFWAIDPPADPYFDQRLNAWVVSRYRDVAAALRDSRLVPALALSKSSAPPLDTAAHSEFRTQALRALSPAAIGQWEERFTHAAEQLATTLPPGEPVDLIDRFAQPWSLQVAGIAAGVPLRECESLAVAARPIFAAACEPYDESLAADAQKATVDLATFFRESPPWSVQMFVALAHSLPALLGNLWLALMQDPAEMEELLRRSGPAKAQFRQAVAPVIIGACPIAQGQLVILRLDIANHDLDRPPNSGHLAFGTGLHSCVGSALIRSAAVIATKALLDRFHLEPPYTAVPEDHFAMRYVRSLEVTPRCALRRADACPSRQTPTQSGSGE